MGTGRYNRIGGWCAGTAALAAAIALVAGLAFAGPPGSAEAAGGGLHNPLLGQPEAIAAGKALYQQHCMSCHRNAGGRGPNLFQTELGDADFFAIVMAGRTGSMGEMPSWTGLLDEEQVWQIEAFVKSRPHF